MRRHVRSRRKLTFDRKGGIRVLTHSEPTAPLRKRMRLTRFSRPTRRTVSLQSVGNLWAAAASDIEGPTDLDWVGLCFETEISRGALDSCMAQERSNCLQIASTFQNVESLRPAFPGSPAMRNEGAG